MIAPDLRAAEAAVMRLEAGRLRAGDLEIIATSWRYMREMNLKLERIVHDAAKAEK